MQIEDSPLHRALAYADEVTFPARIHADRMGAVGQAVKLSERQRRTRYPLRLVRYLIPLAWMRDLREKLGRPLRICEIGVGTGQMKRLVDTLSPGGDSSQPLYSSWCGFTKVPRPELVKTCGYDQVESFDADSENLPDFREFDLVLLLHVLEHLKDPENFLLRLRENLSESAVLIGGVPSTPSPLAAIREKYLRRKYLHGGHWCQFSPRKIHKIVESAGMGAPELVGGFAFRWSGLPFENHLWWMRWNLIFGRLFPEWPGEVYFRTGKPAAVPRNYHGLQALATTSLACL